MMKEQIRLHFNSIGEHLARRFANISDRIQSRDPERSVSSDRGLDPNLLRSIKGSLEKQLSAQQRYTDSSLAGGAVSLVAKVIEQEPEKAISAQVTRSLQADRVEALLNGGS